MGKIDEKAKSKFHPSNVKDWDDLPDDVKDVDIPMSVEEVLDKEITILGYSEQKSEYGKGYYLLIEAELEGEIVEISTGARHVLKQLDKAFPHLPLKTRFQKRGRSYYLGKQ